MRYSHSRKAEKLQHTTEKHKMRPWKGRERTLREQDTVTQYKYYSEILKTLIHSTTIQFPAPGDQLKQPTDKSEDKDMEQSNIESGSRPCLETSNNVGSWATDTGSLGSTRAELSVGKSPEQLKENLDHSKDSISLVNNYSTPSPVHKEPIVIYKDTVHKAGVNTHVKSKQWKKTKSSEGELTRVKRVKPTDYKLTKHSQEAIDKNLEIKFSETETEQSVASQMSDDALLEVTDDFTLEDIDPAELDILNELFQIKKARVEHGKGKKPTKKQAKKPAKTVKKEKENLAKDTKMWQTLFNVQFKSYVQVYSYIGEVNFAIESLNHYHNMEGERAKFKVNDIEIYNELMAALAQQGDITQLKKMFRYLKEDGIKPNLQTYALCLLCCHVAKDLGLAPNIVHSIGIEGYDVRNILVESRLSIDQTRRVLKVLNSVIRGFTPNERPPTPTPSVLASDLYEPESSNKMGKINPYAGTVSLDTVIKKAQIQLGREKSMFVSVKSIEKKNAPTKSKKAMLRKYQEFWKQALAEGFNTKLTAMRHKRFITKGMNIYPFLKIFPAEDYIHILSQEVAYLCSMSSGYSPKTLSLYFGLGEKIMKQFKLQGVDINQQMRIYTDYASMTLDPERSHVNHRECWHKAREERGIKTKHDFRDIDWSNFIKITIGRELFDVILKSILVDAKGGKAWNDFKDWKVPVPAFTLIRRSDKLEGMTTQIQPHPAVVHLMMIKRDLVFKTIELPMVVPPMPWVSSIGGGHLLNTDHVVRRISPRQREYIKTASLEPVYDSLNILGNCAWIVNKPVLDVVTKIFNSGGDKKLEIPINPRSIKKPTLQKYMKDMTSKQKVHYFKERAQHRKEVVEAASLWYSDLYRFSIANMFQDSVFWLPHNLDFRGRTYPIPPHFNHQTADVTRALLKFARGKPLGENGLDWLKLHLINLTGLRKRDSNEERIELANEKMDDILDSAEKPIKGRRWWTESDEPLQTLASCMEIAAVMKSGDPVNFVSHLPVYQDGSCNGLQHYAALGRDDIGAKSVNLYPFNKPSDVYSEVVELVEKKRQRDSEHSEDDIVKDIAQLLEGYVARKVIKQTIMTTVYGVTKYGAKLQVGRRLKDTNFPHEKNFLARQYLVDSTFHSLRQMFTSAKMIQDWFDACSSGISRKCNLPVEWVTPLNFPVVQSYHKPMSKNSYTTITKLFTDTLPPNHNKQINAFPPNFIHSLDSTHMMLTALYCLRAGILFMSVHDCFWTHACDVMTMNRITREQFLALHSLPILENLSQFFQQTYCDIPPEDHFSKPAVVDELRATIQKVPPRGNFDLTNVLKSTYFFS